MSRKPSKKTLKKKCDELWSKLIRQRAGNKCEYCGKSDGKIDAHHILSRRHFSVRWNLENGVALCRYHHQFFAHEDPVAFTEWLKTVKGNEVIDALIYEANQPAVRIPYKEVLELLKEGKVFSIIEGEIKIWEV